MTLLQLKYIVTVAKQGSINKAAKELFIAQPSLTAAIKELEQELGITISPVPIKGLLFQPKERNFWDMPDRLLNRRI